MKIGIIYGSSSGTTQSVAETIAKKLQGREVTVMDVAQATPEKIVGFDTLLLGTSTWGWGELQDDWDAFLPKLRTANLSGKIVALFGLGDSASYPDTFVDGMGIIYDALSSTGCTVKGQMKNEGYSFSSSNALRGDTFVGLPLDDTNENKLTSPRIDDWIKSIFQVMS